MIRIEISIKAKVLIKNLLMIVMIIMTKMKMRDTNIITTNIKNNRMITENKMVIKDKIIIKIEAMIMKRRI